MNRSFVPSLRLVLSFLVVAAGAVSASGNAWQDPVRQVERGSTPRLAEPVAPSSPDAPAMHLSSLNVMKFGGRLTSSSGEPRTGTVTVTFALYSDQGETAPLWMETQSIQLDDEGRYSVLLGATKAEGLPAELFSNGEARWLGLQVEGRAEQPRILLVSVPYAMRAADSERLGGRTAEEFVAVDRLQQEIRKEVERSAELTLEESATKEISSGASDFSASTADQVVLVTQAGTGAGVSATSTGTLANSAALLGTSLSPTGLAPGVAGFTSSTSGRAVFGAATASTGQTFGMLGRSDSTAGTGFQGTATAGTGTTFGVRGIAFSTSGTGVRGDATASVGPTFGLLGTSSSAGGWGVLGLAGSSTGPTIGVEGRVSSADGIAGKFRNIGGGQLLSGVSGSTEVFSVSGGGVVTATSFAGDGSLLTGLASSPEVRIRGINYLAGCDTCSVLTDADDQPTFFVNVVAAMTVNSVTCYSDTGTPTINLQRNDGTPANVLTANLSCSTGGTTTTSFVGGESVLNLNDKLDFVMVTAGGSAHRVLVVIKTTLN